MTTRRLSRLSSARSTCSRPGASEGGVSGEASPPAPGSPNQAVKEKNAAPARLALHAQLSAHHLRQLPADGQPQPRPWMALAHGAVSLHEHLEDVVHLVRGNALAAVPHGEAQADTARPRARHLRHDLHEAAGGELEGVAHQVADDLGQPVRVAVDPVRRLWRNVVAQGDSPLFRQGGEGGQGALEHGPKLEVLGREFHLVRLDAGEVEHVVDDGQQGPGRVPDHVQVFALLRREVHVRDHLGHAQDAADGGADLVAHVGQEPALGPAGPLGPAVGRPELLLHVPAQDGRTENVRDHGHGLDLHGQPVPLLAVLGKSQEAPPLVAREHRDDHDRPGPAPPHDTPLLPMEAAHVGGDHLAGEQAGEQPVVQRL